MDDEDLEEIVPLASAETKSGKPKLLISTFAVATSILALIWSTSGTLTNLSSLGSLQRLYRAPDPSTQPFYDQLLQNSCPAECPFDPFVRPGYLYTDPLDVTKTRWLTFPYNDAHENVVAWSSSKITYNATPAPEMEGYSAPQYMQQLLARDYASLEFMVNKTLLVVGSSHDRNNIMAICKWAGGEYLNKGAHTGGKCFIEPLNFNIILWFSEGANDNEDSISFLEHRVENRFQPWMDEWQVPAPSLLLVASLYWDANFLNRLRTSKEQSAAEIYGSSELLWLRARIVNVLAWLQARYPDAKTMLRTRHIRVSNYHLGIRHVAQLDGAVRAAAEHSSVKMFEWGSKLEGYTEMYDNDQHFKVDGPAMWLAGDMLFFYLHRATVADNCWECHGFRD